MSDVSPRAPGEGCASIPILLGHVVAITGDRRSDELAGHLRFLGADVVHGPMLRTRPMTDDGDRLRALTAAVVSDPPAYLLATTGIGMRAWFSAAASWGLRDALLAALRSTAILARGPKVVGALSEAGLDPAFVEPTGRTSAMIDELAARDATGLHVALQVPGGEMPDGVQRLESLGARLTTVTVYDWTAPDDLTAARQVLRAVVERRVTAVTFTSRPAVRNFVALAADEDVAREVTAALQGPVTAACVGPATATELATLTGASPSVPEQSLLGALVQVVAEAGRQAHVHVRTGAGDDVVVQRRLVDGLGSAVTLSDREAALLGRLVAAGRGVVSRRELLRAVWGGDGVGPSALDTTVARLRRRVAATGLDILTVNGRGYRLCGELAFCPAWIEAGQTGDSRLTPAASG